MAGENNFDEKNGRNLLDKKNDEKDLTKLLESEQRFRASMEHSPIGMALTAINGAWIDVNPALCDFLGYTKEELMEAGFKKVTHPDDRDATVMLAIQMVISGQKSVKLEKRYIHANGQLGSVDIQD